MSDLSVRARNVLNYLEIPENKEAVAEAIRSRRLCVGAKGPRNYGKKTHKELCQWVDLVPEYRTIIFLPVLCPHCGKEISKSGKRQLKPY